MFVRSLIFTALLSAGGFAQAGLIWGDALDVADSHAGMSSAEIDPWTEFQREQGETKLLQQDVGELASVTSTPVSSVVNPAAKPKSDMFDLSPTISGAIRLQNSKAPPSPTLDGLLKPA